MYCLLRPCFQRTFKFVSRVKVKHVCICAGLVILLDFFGAFTHVFEETYNDNFVYPYEGDIHEFVSALRQNEHPAVNPINEYNYTYLYNNQQKCVERGYDTLRIIYLVKSSVDHFDRRLAIRNSWGFEKRFFDVPSRTIFLLGVRPDDDEVQMRVKLEAGKYNDIVQANFTDSYYNNTIKTMMGFKWAVKYCAHSKFYMFVDDDMYVSVRNVLRYIRNPANYPDYLKEPKKFGAHKREIKQSDLLNMMNTMNASTIKRASQHNKRSTVKENTADAAASNDILPSNSQTLSSHSRNLLDITLSPNVEGTSKLKRPKRQIFDFELPSDVRLFTGFVFVSAPHRHKSSKWYVSLQEYPYHLWPPYVTAGAYIVSKEALFDMYYTSLYTKHFRFDDIFLGIVAKKADIEPFHCEEFHFYKRDYTKFNYKYVITSHGYGDPSELLQVWNEQKALGNA